MPNLRSNLLIAAFLFCALVTCRAQEEPQVKVRFISFPKINEPQPVELIVGENETISVDLPTNVISPVYTVKKTAEWTLGKTTTDDKGEPTFKVYGKAPSLAANEQLILVVRNGKVDDEGFKLIPFDDQIANFGGGKYLFFNASKVDIACSIGDAKVVTKPMSHQLVAPKPDQPTENGRELLFVSLYFRKENEANAFYSSNWRFSKKARTIVIMYHEEEGGSIRIHPIRDYLP